MQILENRVAIVTGGTGALGRAVVENFLMAGAKVAVP
jgi:NAD(P)-dependent dehydrogenase (short-subunit alcohol dehydrogenase family)